MKFLPLLSVLLLTACVNSKEASLTNSSIIGGEEVEELDPVVQSTVAIGTVSNFFQAFCTGTLISRNLVITAAHCVEEDQELSVWFNPKLPGQYEEYDKKLVVKVESYARAPVTDLLIRFADIALLKLEQDAPANYRPVTILDPKNRIKKDTKLILAGYGARNAYYGGMNNLTKVETPFIEYGTFRKAVFLNQREGNGACYGDSGGPAYIENNGELFLVGATHGTEESEDSCSVVSIYMDVPKFKRYILKHAKKLNAEAPVFKKI